MTTSTSGTHTQEMPTNRTNGENPAAGTEPPENTAGGGETETPEPAEAATMDTAAEAREDMTANRTNGENPAAGAEPPGNTADGGEAETPEPAGTAGVDTPEPAEATQIDTAAEAGEDAATETPEPAGTAEVDTPEPAEAAKIDTAAGDGEDMMAETPEPAGTAEVDTPEPAEAAKIDTAAGDGEDMMAETPEPAGTAEVDTPEPAEAAKIDTVAETPEPAGTAEVDTPEPAEAAKIDTAAEAGEDAAADAVGETESPAAQIATLETELAETRDQYLRTLAEIENLRKRTEREKAEALRHGGAALARSLLGVHDAFERLMLSIDDEFRANSAQFVDGVELIQRELLTAFEKHDIRSVTPEKGDAFDPNFHQAMFKEIDEEVTTGAVVRMLGSGFTLGDRLLRPATVSIADEPPTASRGEPPPLAATGMDAVEGGAVPPEPDASMDGGAAI